LSWASAAARTVAGTTDNALVSFVNSGSTFAAEANLTFTGSALTVIGTATVGVCGTGHDVKFFGCEAGAYMLYDESEETLEIRGASADATTSTGKLLLTTALTDINANDVIGSINFQAPAEAGGTDAIAIAAGIRAVAQATFTCAVNATDLIFYTGHSEAATEKFRFTSQGEIGIGGTNYGCDGQVLTSGGPGAAAAWEAAGGGDVVCDGSPQLGGDLDAQNNDILNVGAAGNDLYCGGYRAVTANARIYAQSPTIAGVTGIGFFQSVTMADNQLFTFEHSDGSPFIAQNGGVGYGAMFFATYNSATIEAVAGSTSSFTLTCADEGKINIYKSGNDNTITVRNRTNGALNFRVLTIGSSVVATALSCG
jgi:hypothetical protein